MKREKRSPGGYVRALQATIRAAIAKLYEGDKLPTEDELRAAKRAAIKTMRSVKARMPTAQKIAQARRNAVAVGMRKYHQI